jgi:NAD(P)-dependent dehydrogenase (short-subunit alcohol dehydrogenase family)
MRTAVVTGASSGIGAASAADVAECVGWVASLPSRAKVDALAELARDQLGLVKVPPKVAEG